MMCCWNARAELRPTFSELVLRLSYLLGSATGYFDFITITNSQAFESGTPPVYPMPQQQLPDNYVSIYKPHATTSEHPRPQHLQSDNLAMASPSSASSDYSTMSMFPTPSRAERVLEEDVATPPKPPFLLSNNYIVMKASLSPSKTTPTELCAPLSNYEGCDDNNNTSIFNRI